MSMTINLPVPKRELVRTLILDDEHPSADSMRVTLEGMGCGVDVAYNTREARSLLQRRRYQVLLSDVVLGEETIEGDDFVIDNEALMGGASRILYTARGRENIRRWEELEERGVKVIEKGEPSFFSTLESLVSEKLGEEVSRVTARLNDMITAEADENSAVMYPEAAATFLMKAQEILIERLKAKKDSNKKGMFYGGKAYSPNMLIQEIERGTEVGREYLDMFLDLIKHDFGA
jgi:CheY-like chemotaxis protein